MDRLHKTLPPPLTFTNTAIFSLSLGAERFYSCPVLPDDAVGICVDECQGDSDCTGNRKCCSNNCGHTCRNPVTIPYIPPPPLGDGSCQDILDRQDQSPPMLGAYVPQCDDDGRFQSLQCHSDGFCWCVNPYTGRPTSDLTSQDDLDGLNCSGMFSQFTWRFAQD